MSNDYLDHLFLDALKIQDPTLTGFLLPSLVTQ